MKKLLGIVAAVLLAFTSCTQEELVNRSASQGMIQASLEEGLVSRLAVGEGNALAWSAGDAFTMFKNDGASAVWTLQGEGGAALGSFYGDEPEGTQQIVGAAFPASASPSYTWGTLAMTLPAELEYQAGICNLPMWASFTSLDGEISFNHLAALLKIDFTDIPEGYNKLIVTADKALAGTFTANVRTQGPVLALKENGSKSVTVSFTAISGTENDRVFYLPLPVNTYGSLNVSISDGENTLSIADWKNRTIERKKVYKASLTYRTSDAATPAALNAILAEMVAVNPNATVEVTGEIKAEDGAIVIPAEAKKVGLNFVQAPVTTDAAPLVIEEADGTAEGTMLSVSLPTTGEAYVTIDAPNTTVHVEGGGYAQIVAHTAANTLVLGKGTTVKDLLIKGGNVSLKGGKVTGAIKRAAEVVEQIFVYISELAELYGVTLGEGVKAVATDYLTFTADAEQTLTLSQEVATLEYSVGGGEWTDLGTSTVTFGGDKGALRLRGKSSYGTAVTAYNCASIRFGDASVAVACTGDIRTLVDYENYDSDVLDTSNARFSRLFLNCAALTSAPKLPATTLSAECYRQMFYGCTSLTEAPELPATTLAQSCYQSIFQNCTSLIQAPELPATTLVTSCYSQMFYGCSSLKEIPELPAAALVDYCYSGIFAGTAITEAPALPITTLAKGCYSSMFANCKNLTKAPELPATTLVESCYANMFNGCSSLKELPELPATTLVDYCYQGIFAGTAITEAPALPITTLAKGCYKEMFKGCTNLTKAPELPATTLVESCYTNMFNGCSSLKELPELIATTLIDYCYQGIFAGTAITEAPELPITTLAKGCYTSMFANCVNLTKAPELPATTLVQNCYYQMFQGCTSLTEAPELPATTLAQSCYGYMFNGCTALTKAPALPATTLAINCYQFMFESCTSLTEAPELPATELVQWCYIAMFHNCKSLTKAPILRAATMADGCYNWMFRGCSKISEVTMLATTLTGKPVNEWLLGTADTGTFYKSSGLTDLSTLQIPEGWEVKDYVEPSEEE